MFFFLTARLIVDKVFYRIYEDEVLILNIIYARLGILFLFTVRSAVRQTSIRMAFLLDVCSNMVYLLLSFYMFVHWQMPD